MSKVRKLVFAASMLFVLVLGYVILFPDHMNCDAPVVLGDQGKADLIIADLVTRAGGLPKPGARGMEREVSSDNVYAVDRWEIERVNAGNTTTLLGSITDDDPVYSYTIDFRAFYSDGSEGELRWSSWRYGLVLCPFAIAGDGPPGRLEIISAP